MSAPEVARTALDMASHAIVVKVKEVMRDVLKVKPPEKPKRRDCSMTTGKK
jgi:hypothetical protein